MDINREFPLIGLHVFNNNKKTTHVFILSHLRYIDLSTYFHDFFKPFLYTVWICNVDLFSSINWKNNAVVQQFKYTYTEQNAVLKHTSLTTKIASKIQ